MTNEERLDKVRSAEELYRIAREHGWAFMLERLHAIAKLLFEHPALEEALAAAAPAAINCDQRMADSRLWELMGGWH